MQGVLPFTVALQHVPDRELGPLLIHLAAAGFHNPIIETVGGDGGCGQAAAPVPRQLDGLPCADSPLGLANSLANQN